MLTGCSVEYNIDINDELIVDETIKVKELTRRILTQTLDVDKFLDRTIRDYRDDPKYDIYMYEKYTDDEESYVTAKAFYLDFESYKNNKNVKDNMFENFNIINEGNVYTFVYVAKDKKDVEIFNDSELYSNLVDEVKINIVLPFRVLSNNADTSEKETGTYTWVYRKNEDLKNIEIKFDKSKRALKKDIMGVYMLVGVFALIIGISGFVAYKYKSFNKI
jgi:hypothetical protein